MARKIHEFLVDDLDGSDATETLQFGLDSRLYQIDLSDDNAKELRQTLREYVRKATAIGPPSPQNEAKQVRQWAIANGYTVAPRGRIHRDIVAAHRNAKK